MDRQNLAQGGGRTPDQTRKSRIAGGELSRAACSVEAEHMFRRTAWGAARGHLRANVVLRDDFPLNATAHQLRSDSGDLAEIQGVCARERRRWSVETAFVRKSVRRRFRKVGMRRPRDFAIRGPSSTRVFSASPMNP